jgi:hypothetical protein
MTLAGTTPYTLFTGEMHRQPLTILEYSNVLDISKAWRVKNFRVWIKSSAQEMNLLADSLLNLKYQLNTDDMDIGYFNIGDNRTIGMGTTAYNVSGYGYNPDKSLTLGFSGAGVQLMNEEVFMKEDHVVQNKLVLGYQVIGPQQVVEAASNMYMCNYLVELEEYDISPTESIIFNIKAKGQDLSS